MTLKTRQGIQRAEPSIACSVIISAAQLREILGIARGTALEVTLNEHSQVEVRWHEAANNKPIRGV